MIYAIQSVSGGPIKIGYACNVRQRLSHLQIAHYEKLHVLATLETKWDSYTEKLIHERYAKDRIRGEWFKPTPEVLGIVEEMKMNKAEEVTLRAYALRIVEGYRRPIIKRFLAYLKALDAKSIHQG